VDPRDPRRVLEKCGFVVVGSDTVVDPRLEQEIEEFLLRLDTPADGD
jgi:hypothetical protein